MSLVVMATVMSIAAWANARGSSSGSYGGKGGSGGEQFGIQGTITVLGTRGFAITVDGGGGEGKEAKTWQVVCNANTKFMEDGKQVRPSEVKVGTHVGILGGALNQTELLATTVNIGMPSKGKKK